jgi:Fungal Zn(2)-Cys(6) binuclear cluster domain
MLPTLPHPQVPITRSCAQCQKAHHSCSRQHPCQRCIRLGKEAECYFPPAKKRGPKPQRAKQQSAQKKARSDSAHSSSASSTSRRTTGRRSRKSATSTSAAVVAVSSLFADLESAHQVSEFTLHSNTGEATPARGDVDAGATSRAQATGPFSGQAVAPPSSLLLSSPAGSSPASASTAAGSDDVVTPTDPSQFDPFECENPNCEGCVLARRMLEEALELEQNPPTNLAPAVVMVMSRSAEREQLLMECCAAQRSMCYVLRVPYPQRSRSGAWRITELPTVVCANEQFNCMLGYSADELVNGLACSFHCMDTVRRFLTVLRHHAYHNSSEPMNACFVGGIISRVGRRFTFSFQLEFLFDSLGRMEYAYVVVVVVFFVF